MSRPKEQATRPRVCCAAKTVFTALKSGFRLTPESGLKSDITALPKSADIVAVAESVRTLLPGGRIAFSWWDDPSRQRIQGIFRDAIAEVGVSMPPDVPQGHNVYRFSNTGELLRLLEAAGLVEAAVTEHATTYSVPDTETLWRGGLGSLVLTGAAIRQQDKATQDLIRTAFERCASVYKSANGLNLPVAFKVGSGRQPT